jgi:phosphomannomutase
MLGYAAIAGLLAAGCEAVDLGICPTPTVELAIIEERASGGMVITASHNPVEWNGLKLIGEDGVFLDAEKGQQVVKLYHEGLTGCADWQRVGRVSSLMMAIEQHIQRILTLTLIDAERIRARRFRVVVDCVNGAGGVIVPDLLRRLGCDVITLNGEPAGRFAHPPEPLPEHLGDLCRVVREVHADVGFAVDPDADRLAIVSEQGEAIGEEFTVTLATKFVLGKRPGPVVVNLSTTRMIDDVAAVVGVPVERTPVGEVYVAHRMQEIGASAGGEGNGGVMLPDLHLGRDAPLGIALVLSYLAETGVTVSDLARSVPNYTMIKWRIDLAGLDSRKAIEQVTGAYKDEMIDLRDGVKIVRERSWIHIRPSNTEPIMRIFAEAETREEAEGWCDEVAKVMRAVI